MADRSTYLLELIGTIRGNRDELVKQEPTEKSPQIKQARRASITDDIEFLAAMLFQNYSSRFSLRQFAIQAATYMMVETLGSNCL